MKVQTWWIGGGWRADRKTPQDKKPGHKDVWVERRGSDKFLWEGTVQESGWREWIAFKLVGHQWVEDGEETGTERDGGMWARSRAT